MTCRYSSDKGVCVSEWVSERLCVRVRTHHYSCLVLMIFILRTNGECLPFWWLTNWINKVRQMCWRNICVVHLLLSNIKEKPKIIFVCLCMHVPHAKMHGVHDIATSQPSPMMTQDFTVWSVSYCNIWKATTGNGGIESCWAVHLNIRQNMKL